MCLHLFDSVVKQLKLRCAIGEECQCDSDAGSARRRTGKSSIQERIDLQSVKPRSRSGSICTAKSAPDPHPVRASLEGDIHPE